MDILLILPLESNKSRLLLHMHEVKGSAKLRGDSYYRRPSHHTNRTAKDHFRSVYYEALDLIVSVIDKHFSNQESFSSYAQMETLFAANGEDYESDFKFLETSYFPLPRELSVLEAMLKIEPKKKLFQEVQIICWLLTVNPATNAFFLICPASEDVAQIQDRRQKVEKPFPFQALGHWGENRASASKRKLSGGSREGAFPPTQDRPTDREPGTGYNSLGF